ncbi:sulfatase [Halieaceae bacterium IMCC14734]|uniref:Sulfatase n=1 Tax=Candidatus Litorirhabdus singularis TaxID=2518993 RepID=A0ABT3TGB3_9GAMM|nr:sulfatase-like hydrolase/transferase [Candidatus Litorirhabdus singularis]MCX2981318.1 sulfatase [Candidatus Litorirhabdus singularis]
MYPYIKTILFALALALGYAPLLQRIQSFEGVAGLLAYLVLVGLVIFGVILGALSRLFLVRLAWAILLSGGVLFELSYFHVMADHLTYDAFLELYASRNFLGDAMQQYAQPLLASLPCAAALFAAILMSPARSMRPGESRIASFLSVIGPAGVILALSVLLFARGGSGASALPFGIPVYAFFSLAVYEEVVDPDVARLPVTIPRTGDTLAGDLVLIIDESLRGDYLDINHPRGVDSGLQENYPGIEVLNLGLSVSATNCSIGSNMILRFGGRRDNYREHLKSMPSIWEYAAKAGLATVYIDAQSEHRFFNGMTDEEIAHIGRIIQFHGVEPLYRDIEAGKALKKLLADDVQQLILVNKLGPHFPINDKYPPTYARFQPSLPTGSFVDTAVSGRMPELFSGQWDLYKNSYKNTIEWTVGQFFRELLTDLELNQTLIFYTGDHGQSFHERGEPGLRSHCTPGAVPAMEEGVVPMVVIGGTALNPQLQAVLLKKHNASSHYALFPTLLEALGYDSEQVEAVYGPSLLSPLEDPMTFNSRFRARLGLLPVWNRVDINELVSP